MMIIRQAQTKDIDKIYKLGKNTEEFIVNDQTAGFWPKHILKKCIESKTDWIIIAEDLGEITGFIIVNNNPVFRKAIIENVFVLPKYRRQGVGDKLLIAAFKKIKQSGCEYVCALIGINSKPAIDFYINNGFGKGKNFTWMDKVLTKNFRS